MREKRKKAQIYRALFNQCQLFLSNGHEKERSQFIVMQICDKVSNSLRLVDRRDGDGLLSSFEFVSSGDYDY